jgi:hypothetical protein
VPDDEIGERSAAADGMERRRPEGEQGRPLAEGGIDRDEALRRCDDAL